MRFSRAVALGSARLGAFLLILSCLACGERKEATSPVRSRDGQAAPTPGASARAAVEVRRDWAPRLVLIEQDPWASVIGSDPPRFALYRDGSVIWRRDGGFRTARLSSAEVASLLANLEAMRSLGGFYRGTESTDQPISKLLVYGAGEPILVSIYGRLESPEVRAKLPVQVLQAFDTLWTFDLARGAEWLPEKFEVMVWPYDYASEPSISWPEDLPDLHDPQTRKRGDLFSIYVPSSRLSEVREFLARRKERGAIEINGKKWAASIRFPFPGERLWMAPRGKSAER